MAMPYFKRLEAFTLIELMVVVAIIGLLGTLAAVGLTSARTKARDNKRVADIKQLQKALEVSYVAPNGYPISASAITLGAAATKVLCNIGGVPTFQATTAGCGTIHMNPVPYDPTSAQNYTYKSYTSAGVGCASAPCASYCIQASLEQPQQALNFTAGSIMADQTAFKNGSCP